VVGAGVVGLATAWFLQERDIAVTVLERDHVGAGASWGNAGWLSPALAAPLPEPAVVRYGAANALRSSAPVYVPPRLDPKTLAFLARFLRNSTASRWRAGMAAMAPLNQASLDGFDALVAGGVGATVQAPPAHLMCFRSEQERLAMEQELDHIRDAGQPIEVDVLDGHQARALNPAVSPQVTAALALKGQRFLDPGALVTALAEAVVARGGRVETGSDVRAVRDVSARAELAVRHEGLLTRRAFDAVVLANGAWLAELTRRLGVRVPVQPGRGYSFTTPCEVGVTTPLYFPVQRVACTPVGDRVRVAGMMELRPPEAPIDPGRLAAVADSVRALLVGVDLDDRRDEWVGSRPLTSDGLPLVGPTRSTRIWVAGGHGMWGVTQGPATARLVARGIATGQTPSELAPFDPLR
jgi:D-amino-acid dehydrogenase